MSMWQTHHPHCERSEAIFILSRDRHPPMSTDGPAGRCFARGFDRETRGLEPDYKLPDLLLPGRPKTGAPAQAEFVQVPADYVKEASIARLAADGRTAHAEASRQRSKRSNSASACRARSCSRSGAARPTMAATRCLTMRSACTGDAGLCRPAQGSVSRRIHRRPEADPGRRCHAQESALVMGRRDGPHAIPAVGIVQARRRFR
jgi:hypothetical protein